MIEVVFVACPTLDSSVGKEERLVYADVPLMTCLCRAGRTGRMGITKFGVEDWPLVLPATRADRRRAVRAAYREEGLGGAEGNRTPDLFIANEALSHLSYGPDRRGKCCRGAGLSTASWKGRLRQVRCQQAG